MTILAIKIHQSLWIEGEKNSFSGDFNGKTILEAMNALLEEAPKIKELCLKDNKRRPGILYIYDKTELASLGLFDELFTEDLLVRIVPILHGG